MAEVFSKVVFVTVLLFVLPQMVLAYQNEIRDERSYDRQVITSEMLEEMGVARLRDIMEFLDFWPAFSTERQNWYPSPNGLSSYQTQNWLIMIDGEVIDMQILGKPNISTLPLRIEEISYIEIIQTPQQYLGLFTDQGVVHFHTKLPNEGFTFQFRSMLGQEVHEPGPYEYTDLKSQNEESSGPDVETGVNWRKGNWSASVGYTYNEDKHTDHPVSQRLQAIKKLPPGVNSNGRVFKHSGNVRLAFNNERNSYRIAASLTRFEDYFFNPVFGQEIPVFTHHRQIGASGHYNLNNGGKLHYSSRFSNRGLEIRPNRFEVDFDLFLNTISSYLVYNHSIEDFDFSIGSALETEEALTSYDLVNDIRLTNRYFFSLGYQWSGRIRQVFDFGISTDYDDIALQAAMRHQFDTGPETQLTTSITYSERLLSEFHSLWYLFEQGYGIFDDFDISVDQAASFTPRKQLTADIAFSLGNSDDIKFTINPFARSLSNFPLTSQEYSLSPGNMFILTDDVSLLNNETVITLGFKFLLDWQLSDRLSSAISYGYHSPISVSEKIEPLWKVYPRHQASAILSWNPVDGFSIWSRFSFVSSTEWTEYEPLDGAEYRETFNVSYDNYSNTIPPKYRLDISARKSFLGERLHGTMRIRNALNHRYLYHPVGANYDLAMYMIVSLNL